MRFGVCFQQASNSLVHGRMLLLQFELPTVPSNIPQDASTLRSYRERNSRGAQHNSSEEFGQTETLLSAKNG